MKILGIDPGSTRAGYGVIETNGRDITLLNCGLLKVTAKDKQKKLVDLGNSYLKLLKKEKPDLVALEKLFFVKNIKTGLEVAEARGVINLITAQNKIKTIEFAPSEVKLNVAGYGSADKKAIEKMVCIILNRKDIKGPDDVFDAIAIAIAASNHSKNWNKIF
ncbi:MAG: crossover junction endodeoxyribonuclease RuvC [Patescibacteria group bacterium]|nr:crossover junction endodeoxyribonuclease RuvC [Patescibacteria group bacterium]